MALKTFKHLQEIERNLNNTTKRALNETLNDLVDIFKETIEEDVYNAYTPKYYAWRTRWLLQDGVIKSHIYSNFGKGYSGQISIDETHNYPVSYGQHIHSGTNGRNNDSAKYEILDSETFIEMLNNQVKVNPNNPFHFPVVKRKPFLDDFKKEAEKQYPILFRKHFEEIGGIELRGVKKISGSYQTAGSGKGVGIGKSHNYRDSSSINNSKIFEV